MNDNKFQIDQQETEDAYLLYISGELDLSVVPELRSALKQVVNRSDKALILDLMNLKYIDSTGIGVIVSVLKIREELKARLIIREIPPPIQRLFDITGISKYVNNGTEAEI